jgi:ectoine hydroxylase
MLSPQDLELYREQGYLLIEGGLRPAEVECLNKQAKTLFAQDSADRIMEKDGRTVRGVHACHERDQVCHDLVRHPRVLGPARQILDGEVYVHQFKINAKLPVSGDLWPWHQDYTFWQREDGMARPEAVNLAVFLDDATDVNGALLFVPGSHKLGVIDTHSAEEKPETDEFWATHLSADLEYTIDAAALARIVSGRGIHSATGPAGSILIFDACIVHGSGTNMSPNPRGMAMVTYNRTSNALPQSARPRPEFLAARDTTMPLQPYDEDFLLTDRAPSMSS